MKGFVIAATGSGTGKTTVCLAILAYLRARGIRVAPFKVGPDFIDPGHHSKIAGRTSVNLDSWMLTRAYNQRLFAEGSTGAEVAVVEGVMGLFDGYDALTETGSTAQMAKWLGLPVLLIVSAKGKARSAAAIVKGFESFDPDLTLAGVIFSQTGSQRHYEYLRDAVEQNCTTPCLGFMPKNEKIVMPERHLGLMTADELEISPEVLALLVSMVADHMDMDRLMAGLPVLDPGKMGEPDTIKSGKHRIDPIAIEQIPSASTASAGPVIAVARDKAFCFYYQDNIDSLKAAGAKIVFFSPLTDDQLPGGIDGIYLGGGYPEIFAKSLSEKRDLLAQIAALSRSGMPIYGECGGFMYLCRQVSAMDREERYEMTGCFDFSVQMSRRLRSLGYREITLTRDTIIGTKGAVIRGHEFHYSSLMDAHSREGVENVYQVTTRAGQDISLEGYQKNLTLGSYLHVHFGSSPGCARAFVNACADYRQTRPDPKTTGPSAPPDPTNKEQAARTLKQGFTTGAAAAASVKAALLTLVTSQPPQTVEIEFLTGERRNIPVQKILKISATCCQASVIKDAGDDPDITHKAEIGATVTLSPARELAVVIKGGRGVGRVTKPGLEVPVGEPAINSGPKRMILNVVDQIRDQYTLSGNEVTIEIFVPRGERLAKKTLNARLGIIGGISILGTTGIVKPMSHDAYIATIRSSISVAMARRIDTLVFTTGRRSERFAMKLFPRLLEEAFVQTGDFFKAAIDEALATKADQKSCRNIIYTVFFGKAVKMSLGFEHTHAAKSDLTLGKLAHWAREITGDERLVCDIKQANTARHAFSYIMPDYPELLAFVGKKIQENAGKFARDQIQIRVIILDFDGQVAFDSQNLEDTP